MWRDNNGQQGMRIDKRRNAGRDAKRNVETGIDMTRQDGSILTMATRKKRRGGWPKRERVPAGLRLSPELGAWLTATAERVGRSRTQLMEMWLDALRDAGTYADQVRAELSTDWPTPPDEAFKAVGERLLGRLIDLGLLNDFVRQGREVIEEERAAQLRRLRGKLK
jgi:hypothetical protein